ncbi:MAG: phosphatidate cytidylyltransferase [Oxalobacter sp.]|jgi:dolichol kinase|nr:phosphatidate cytidylyltransferase [Oxalobacter sp.]
MSKQIPYIQEVLRKGIHLSSLWMVVAMGILPRLVNIALFSVLLVGCVITEYGNHKGWKLFTATYGALFNRMLREREKQTEFRLSGAPYLIGAALMCVVLFPTVIAMASFSVMLIGDTVAALIGRRYGRHPINRGTKSLEGSIAFCMAGFAIVCFFYFFCAQPMAFLVSGFVGIVAAAIAEAYENRIHIDDNFSIPLAVGVCLYAGRLFF